MRRELILILCIGVIGAVSCLTLAFAVSFVPTNNNADPNDQPIVNRNPPNGSQNYILRPTDVTTADLSENYSVIVVGAGMAGLEAAHQLESRGMDEVVVLEASDRIGGRTWTVNQDGLSLDLGGSWIHGGINDTYKYPIFQNPLYKIAKDNGIKVAQTDHTYAFSFYDSSGNKLPTTDAYCSDDFQNFSKKWGKTNLHSHLSIANVSNNYYSYMNYTAKKNPDWIKFEFFLYWDFIMDQGDEAAKISSADLYNELSDRFYFNDELFHETIFPNGGYAQIYNNLTKGLDIKHANVTKIDYTGDVVSVTTANNETFHAKYVISTLPLGVLQHKKVEFVPNLDKNKTHAINNLGMNVMDKAYFIFNKSNIFWNNDMNKDWIDRYPDNENDTGWLTFFNLYNYTKKYNPDRAVLLAFNTGDFARILENKTDDEIKREGLKVLSRMYQNSTINYSNPDIVVTRHYNDHTRYGSYSYLGTNATIKDFDYLAEPADNKLFFAGEATNKYYVGTVHGAYISGFRAAEQILKLEGRSDGPLTQLKHGIKVWDLSCPDGLTLMNRTSTNEFVCLKNSESLESLRLSAKSGSMSIPDDWRDNFNGTTPSSKICN